MAPDIEWRIGDETEQQTIAKSPPPQPSRWRKPALVIVVALGIGLGVAYRSIPEPPAPSQASVTPAATAAPIDVVAISTPRPRSLIDTIEFESQALAEGDRLSFAALQDPATLDWNRWQLDRFGAWGLPPGIRMYNLLESGWLPDGTFWADVRQYRHGRFFRETRFYRQHEGQWVRTQPDAALWSGGQQITQTAHFQLIFDTADANLAYQVADQFEQIYARVCSTLDCEHTLDGTPAQGLPITLSLQPEIKQYWLELVGQPEFHLPSPRVMGIYDRVLPTEARPGLNDQLQSFATDQLIFLLAQHASGGLDHWAKTLEGRMFVQAIETWTKAQLGPLPEAEPSYPIDLSASYNLLPLDALWSWSITSTEATHAIVWQESEALIQFVGETYGPPAVIKFLKALPAARSLPEVIEGIGLSYAEFDRQWQIWLRQSGAMRGGG